MGEEPEQQSFDGRAWQIGMGIVCLFTCLAIILMFASSIHYEGFRLDTLVGAIWLVMVLGGLGLNLFARPNRRWAERAGSIASTLAVLGIAAIFAFGLIRRLRDMQEIEPAEGLLIVFACLWMAVGLALFATGRRDRELRGAVLGSPAIVVVWPFLFLMKGWVGAVLLALMFGIPSAGYLIGDKLGHPFIGAALPVAALAIIAAIARIKH